MADLLRAHRFARYCRQAETPAERWLDSGNLVARVNLPNMRGGARDRVEVYARAVSGLLALEPDGARRAKYMDFIDIYAGLTENELSRYRRQHPEEGDIVTGFIHRAREEGIEQGRAEGERALLERLLQQRFDVLPPETAERLRRAPETLLETWADHVLEAKTLDEVFRATPRGTVGAKP